VNIANPDHSQQFLIRPQHGNPQHGFNAVRFISRNFLFPFTVFGDALSLQGFDHHPKQSLTALNPVSHGLRVKVFAGNDLQFFIFGMIEGNFANFSINQADRAP